MTATADPADPTKNRAELVWHDRPKAAPGLLVMVHGFGEGPSAALQLGSLLDPHRKFQICAPVGPLEVGRHKRSFYRSTSRMTPDPTSLAAAVEHLHQAINRACERRQIERSAVVLAGMSQGAGLAAIAALGASSHPAPRGLVLFSGRPYPAELVTWDPARAAATRIFAAHGDHDSLSPSGEMRDFLDRVEPHVAAISWHRHSLGHTLDVNSVAAAATWLSQLPD